MPSVWSLFRMWRRDFLFLFIFFSVSSSSSSSLVSCAVSWTRAETSTYLNRTWLPVHVLCFILFYSFTLSLLSLTFPWKINSFSLVSPSEGRPENLSDRAKEQKQGRNEGCCKLLWRCMTGPEPVNIDGGEVVTEIVGRRRWQDRVAVWWMVGNKRLVSLRSPPLPGVGTSVFVINAVWHGEQKFVLLLFSFSFVVLCSCLLCSTPVYWTAAVCWMYYSCFVHWTKMLD